MMTAPSGRAPGKRLGEPPTHMSGDLSVGIFEGFECVRRPVDGRGGDFRIGVAPDRIGRLRASLRDGNPIEPDDLQSQAG
jgi:hypothetical protein